MTPSLAPLSGDRLLDSLDAEQRAAVESRAHRLFVLAGPGSGKTRVLAARVVHLLQVRGAPSHNVVAFTFSRAAAAEVRTRVVEAVGEDLAALLTVSTFHGMACRIIRAASREALDGRSWPADPWRVADEQECDEVLRGLFRGPTARPESRSTGIGAVRHASTTHAAYGRMGRGPEWVLLLTWWRRLADLGLVHPDRLVPVARSLIAGDRGYHDPQARRTVEHVRFVLIDEGQDLTQTEWELATSLGSSPDVTVVADDRQCIPAGQLVATPNGERPIESIAAGDSVLASVNGRIAPRRVARVTRSSKPTAIEFTTESGRVFRATPDHLLFASVGDPRGHYVYLMYRAGYGFRVGVSSMGMRRGRRWTHLVRTQSELAERMWILARTPDAGEAHRIEHAIAYRYRVPMAPFKVRGGTMFSQDEQVVEFFSEFRENGHEVLRAFGLSFDRPAYIAKSSRSGRVAANLAVGLRWGCEVIVESAHVPEAVRARFGFLESRRGCQKIRRRIKSPAEALALASDVAREAGGYVVETLAAPWADRRLFATQAAGVWPTMLVPEQDGEGGLRLVAIKSRRDVESSDCYDLEVEDVSNFIVGGVVVHNCIYGWRGATAFHDVIASEARGGAESICLPRSYRFATAVARHANQIAESLDTHGAPIQCLPGAERGTVEQGVPATSLRTYVTGLAAQYGPAGVAVLARTRIECERVAGELGPDLARWVRREPDLYLRIGIAMLRLEVRPTDNAAARVVLAHLGLGAGEIERLADTAGQARGLWEQASQERPALVAALPDVSGLPWGAVGAVLGGEGWPESMGTQEALDALAEHEQADRFAECAAAGLVPVATVHGFKGKEAEAVVLVTSKEWPGPRPRAEELRVLFVASTRARRHLIVMEG